jgi:hypothetical protein
MSDIKLVPELDERLESYLAKTIFEGESNLPWDQDAVALNPPQYLSGEEMFELAVDENRQ